jgi:hypothetical protein
MFTDLLNTTNNNSYLHVQSSEVDWSIPYDVPNPPTKMIFSEILQRIPDIKTEFILWTEKSPLLLRVSEFQTKKDKFIIKVRAQDNLKEIVSYAADRIIIKEEGNSRNLQIDQSDCPMFINSYVEKSFGSIPNFYLAQPFPDNVCVAQIPLTFILSYCIGMLRRYFPSHWVALSKGHIGDEA